MADALNQILGYIGTYVNYIVDSFLAIGQLIIILPSVTELPLAIAGVLPPLFYSAVCSFIAIAVVKGFFGR